LRKWLRINDETLTFRLLDLPPELRNAIFTYYFDSLPDLKARYCEPPICLTSRLIRKESIPLFYGRCTFDLTFAGSTTLLADNLQSFEPRLLCGNSTPNFAYIRRIDLFQASNYRVTLFKIDLHRKPDSRVSIHTVQLRDGLSLSPERVRIWAAYDAKVTAALGALAPDVMSREPYALRRSDLGNLHIKLRTSA
jgi:hypothetical protein